MIAIARSIKHSTVSANIPSLCSLDSHSAQLGYSSDEVGVEGFATGSEGIYGRPGPCVREENLVGGKEAFTLQEILVINIVELSGSGWIHVNGYSRIHNPRAH